MNRNISLAAAAVVIVAGGLGIWYSSAPKAPAPIAAAPAPAVITPAAAQVPAAVPAPAQAPQQAAAVDPAVLAPRAEGTDMVMGAPNAPVTLIEYASLTCPHCRAFATETFPQLKAEYIDKGLLKYIYRDFPLDGAALQASKIARCAGPERYFTFIEVIFAQQPNWIRASSLQAAVQNLKPLARLGGMSDAAFDACIANTEVENIVLNQRQTGEKEWQVDATPTLIVNGRKYKGSYEFNDFDQFLRPLAGKV